MRVRASVVVTLACALAEVGSALTRRKVDLLLGASDKQRSEFTNP